LGNPVAQSQHRVDGDLCVSLALSRMWYRLGSSGSTASATSLLGAVLVLVLVLAGRSRSTTLASVRHTCRGAR
jgi:hypothetical protein